MELIYKKDGSGVPNIYSVWEDKGWKKPDVEEQYGPDRTILTLSFEKSRQKKQAEKTGDNKNRINGGLSGGLSGGINGGLNEELACKIIGVINDNNYISVLAISEKLNIPKRTVEREMKKLRDLGRIVRQGSKKKGYWEVH